MPDTTTNPPFGAIFGCGRSGTTWLGAIVDSHPDVVYRFEPFHRQKSNPQLTAAWDQVRKNNFDAPRLLSIAAQLRRPNPRLERAPFFPKSSGFTFAKPYLNRVSCKLNFLSPLYKALYPTPKNAKLIFKEVSMEHQLRNLAQSGSVPIIYILRHPAACISSMLKGIEEKVMPIGRANAAFELAKDRAPTLYEKFKDQESTFTLEEKLALVWTVDTDFALESCEPADTVLTVIYEDLCRSTLPQTEKILAHFGLEMTDQTRTFISGTAEEKTKNEFGVKSYFSINRDPVVAMNRWKKTISQDQTDRIRIICQEGKAMKAYSDRWDWSVTD